WGSHTATGDAVDIQLGCTTGASPTALDTSLIPGAAFQNIPVNHWIHLKYWFDFTTNTMMGASIRDITAAGPTITIDFTGRGWGLLTTAAALPSAIRFFAGGNGPVVNAGDGNTIAWDNLVLQPETFAATTGACCRPDGTCGVLDYNACATASGIYRGDNV